MNWRTPVIKRSRIIRLRLGFVFLLQVSIILLSSCLSDTHGAELRSAFERYLTVLNEAQINLDTSHLPEVAISPRLDELVSGVEDRGKFTAIVSEEFKIEWVKVIRYTETEATIQVKYNYRPFSQDFKTGERTYGPTARWYWRIIEADLVQDKRVWKVKEITFVDWSG
jgi:hypothetical protein